MSGRFHERVVVLAGAGASSPGWSNGKAAAVGYAREGAHVVCVDIVPEGAEDTRSTIETEGGSASVFVADVSQAAQVQELVDSCINAYGRIDVLHNNVGVVENGSVVDASEESWDRVHDVNLKSVFLTCKHVLPHMISQGGGAIVNISSTAAIRDMGISYCSYSSTKAALLQLTRAIAIDYAHCGIRANTILPGIIHTPLVEQLYSRFGAEERDRMVAKRNQQIPVGRMGDAWDVANAALFLASDDARYITGTELVVDGGLTARCLS